jgi:hypothetical protein
MISFRAEVMSQVIEQLPGKHKALSSKLSTTKKKKFPKPQPTKQ